MAANDESAGAWIFVSHSHRDIEDVRRIRDALEAKGHQPLLFFLKCLDDGAELDELIRREIDARSFFLLCESENSRRSRWVQSEVEFIKGLQGKVFVSVELGADWDQQLEAIDALSRQATVFIAHAPSDTEMAERVASTLRDLDFGVSTGASGEGFEGAVDAALARGMVVALLSAAAVTSPEVERQMGYVLARAAEHPDAKIVPVAVGGDLPPGWEEVPAWEWAIERNILLLSGSGDAFSSGIRLLASVLNLREPE